MKILKADKFQQLPLNKRMENSSTWEDFQLLHNRGSSGHVRFIEKKEERVLNPGINVVESEHIVQNLKH